MDSKKFLDSDGVKRVFELIEDNHFTKEETPFVKVMDSENETYIINNSNGENTLPADISSSSNSVILGDRSTLGEGCESSVIEGHDNTINNNSSYSHAEGNYNNITNGSQYSHVEGNGNTISESAYSHAEGNGHIISGNSYYSHVEGSNNIISGSSYSHAEGNYNKIINGSSYSHAEGYNNTISGGSSYSHAEGYGHTINGSPQSHAEGYGHTISGSTYAHAEGDNHTISMSSYSHAEGEYNRITDNSQYSHAEGYNNTISGNSQYSHAEGSNNIISGGCYHSHAEGLSNKIINGSQYSHVEGSNNIISGGCYYSHAEGYGNVINNGSSYSHAEGNNNIIYENSSYAHVEGYGNEVKNMTEHASGYLNKSTTKKESSFGDSENTLFSVGNGLRSNRHNAFEIKQSGDIYIPDTQAEGEFYEKPMVKLPPFGEFDTPVLIYNTGNASTLAKAGNGYGPWSVTFSGKYDTTKKYKIVINDTVYDNLTTNSESGFLSDDYTGTSAPLYENSNFILMSNNTQTTGQMYFKDELPTNSTIEIYQYTTNIKKLDSKYLPAGSGAGSANADWDAEEGEEGFIKNKPFENIKYIELYSIENYSNSQSTGNAKATLQNITLSESINSGEYYRVDIGTRVYSWLHPLYGFLSDNYIGNASPLYANSNFILMGNNIMYFKEELNNVSIKIYKIEGGIHKLTGSVYNERNFSHTEGQNTTASGGYSHAEGQYTNAIGYYSHAEGGYTNAIGLCSHAEGTYTNAIGDYSHTEGDHTNAIGYHSHAEGSSTTASGLTSHTEGYYTNTLGYYSHAEGGYTTTENYYEHAEGYCNISYTTNSSYFDGSDGKTILTVGNGVSQSTRHNALEVRQSGDIYISDTNAEGVYYEKPMLKLQDHLFISWVGTQEEYDAIQTKDSNTFYFIKEEED